uniref:NADAR domain-containing protein n=1 Tax=Meloidogyne javanica TaxID=6303 RepID=A0A915LJ82_MELJA
MAVTQVRSPLLIVGDNIVAEFRLYLKEEGLKAMVYTTDQWGSRLWDALEITTKVRAIIVWKEVQTMDLMESLRELQRRYSQDKLSFSCGDRRLADGIKRGQLTPAAMKRAAEDSQYFNQAEWNLRREQVMIAALEAKYSQDRTARQALLATGDMPILECSVNKTWGIGVDIRDERRLEPCIRNDNMTGQNLLGRLLMDLRWVIREEERLADQTWEGQMPEFALQIFRQSTVNNLPHSHIDLIELMDAFRAARMNDPRPQAERHEWR